MKKIATMILVGLTSSLLQFNVLAEDKTAPTSTTDQVPVADTPSSTDITAEKAADVSATDEQAAAPDQPSKPEAPVAPEPPAKKMPDILGKSIEVRSLRGSNKVSSESELFPNRRIMVVDGGIDVTFSDQPPMIPHNIDKDRISLQENSCLKCHSKVDSKLENAPKPTPSHFRGRDGKKQKEIVAGRYFCTQCHAPQANTKPVVKNQFVADE